MDTRELSPDAFEELTQDVFATLEDLFDRQCNDKGLSMDPVVYSLCRSIGIILARAEVTDASEAEDIASGATADGFRSYNLHKLLNSNRED